MPDWWWRVTAGCCKALESLTCRLFGHDRWLFEEGILPPEMYPWCGRCGRGL